MHEQKDERSSHEGSASIELTVGVHIFSVLHFIQSSTSKNALFQFPFRVDVGAKKPILVGVEKLAAANASADDR